MQISAFLVKVSLDGLMDRGQVDTWGLKLLSHTDAALTAKASRPTAPRGALLLRCCDTGGGGLHRERSPSPTTWSQLENPADTHTSSGESSALTFLFLAAQGLGANWV